MREVNELQGNRALFIEKGRFPRLHLNIRMKKGGKGKYNISGDYFLPKNNFHPTTLTQKKENRRENPHNCVDTKEDLPLLIRVKGSTNKGRKIMPLLTLWGGLLCPSTSMGAGDERRKFPVKLGAPPPKKWRLVNKVKRGYPALKEGEGL